MPKIKGRGPFNLKEILKDVTPIYNCEPWTDTDWFKQSNFMR